jgi:hypothetical protein
MAVQALSGAVVGAAMAVMFAMMGDPQANLAALLDALGEQGAEQSPRGRERLQDRGAQLGDSEHHVHAVRLLGDLIGLESAGLEHGEAQRRRNT